VNYGHTYYVIAGFTEAVKANSLHHMQLFAVLVVVNRNLE